MELDKMEECIKECQLAIAKHEERFAAIQDNMKRQNGLLGDVKDVVENIVKKVDAMGLSIANRINEIERSSIHRDTVSNIATKEDIERFKTDILQTQLANQKTLLWKIIGTVCAVGLVAFSVIFSFLITHTFGI